jgi:hypothetical protein
LHNERDSNDLPQEIFASFRLVLLLLLFIASHLVHLVFGLRGELFFWVSPQTRPQATARIFVEQGLWLGWHCLFGELKNLNICLYLTDAKKYSLG